MVIKYCRDVDKYFIAVIGIGVVAPIMLCGDSLITTVGNMDNPEKLLLYVAFGVFSLFCVWLGVNLVKDRSRRYVLSEKGCEIYGWRGYYKSFSWDEARAKYIVHTKKGEERGLYKGIAVLSTRVIDEKSSFYNPLKYNSVYHIASIKGFIYGFFCPLDIIYIYLSAKPQECDTDGCWFYEKIDEKTFRQKMAEWHVELAEEKEELPPWKEQI